MEKSVVKMDVALDESHKCSDLSLLKYNSKMVLKLTKINGKRRIIVSSSIVLPAAEGCNGLISRMRRFSLVYVFNN